MRYRTFPGTDLQASEVGFGVWTLTAGWWGDHTEADAVAMLRKGLDLGVTFYDTADTYGNGYGEEILDKAFGARRKDVVIATKGGYDFYTNPGARNGQREWPQDMSPKFIRFALEKSLKRLNTDYVDLYQLHNVKLADLRSDELFAELDLLVKEGKIRHYAVALGPAIGWLEDGVYAMEHRKVKALQIIHNILEQDPGRAFIEVGQKTGCGMMVRVPHSSGMLEGHYTKDTTFPLGDHRNHRPKEWLTEGLKKIERLKFLYEDRGMTLGQAALKWLLAEPLVMTCLPNIYNEEQLVEFATAPDKPDLTADDLRQVAELYDNNFYLEKTPAAV